MRKNRVCPSLSGFNSILVNIKSFIKLNDAVKIKLKDNEGTIWFIRNEENKETQYQNTK